MSCNKCDIILNFFYKLYYLICFILIFAPRYEKISLHNSVDSFPFDYLFGGGSIHRALLLCPL